MIEYDTQGPKKEETATSSGWRKYLVSGNELVIVMVLNLIALGLGLWLNDLGAVLAFVGAIGGSTACFIMPGLIYIGVNGAEFLQLIRDHLELPDDINSSRENQVVKDEHSYLAGNRHELIMNICTIGKPWWYYVFGFPIWCRIASFGLKNMSCKMDKHEISDVEKYPSNQASADMSLLDIPPTYPCRRRFSTAIFLILFGIAVLVMPMV
jgi:hypothetical protein